jgi:hypothetical protein
MAKTLPLFFARLQGAAFCLSLALGACTLAQAAPPPGHPSASQALGILMPNKPEGKDLSQAGQVLSTMDANEFTYIEVKRADAVEWIAVPLMAIKPGSTIRYEEGIVMADFYSKLLKRTFPSVRFVGQIEVKAGR